MKTKPAKSNQPDEISRALRLLSELPPDARRHLMVHTEEPTDLDDYICNLPSDSMVEMYNKQAPIDIMMEGICLIGRRLTEGKPLKLAKEGAA